MGKICVIGSLNIDLTVSVPRFHQPGETIFGTDFRTYTGGKGGNQAVAAAKLGADVTMVGCLGDDANSGIYRSLLRSLNIRDRVETVPGVPSGVALIEVDSSGENRIAVVPGANGSVSEEQIGRNMEIISACDIVLMQLEIPLKTVAYAAERIRAAGKTLILDPAPAAPLPDELLTCADYITPKETELAILSGRGTGTEEEIEAAARGLLSRGCRNVIAKMGSRGAMLVSASGTEMMPGFSVRAVDTTAAGDSFNAGFAAALSEGRSVPEAIRFANAVGALSTTAVGAQGAMPTREEAEAFLAAR